MTGNSEIQMLWQPRPITDCSADDGDIRLHHYFFKFVLNIYLENGLDKVYNYFLNTELNQSVAITERILKAALYNEIRISDRFHPQNFCDIS